MLVRATSSVRIVAGVSGSPSALTITVHRLALGHRPGQPAQPAEQRGQVHLRRVDVQLPRLGLGHVEQVVDQGQQGAARVPDELDLVEPLGVEAVPSGAGSASSRVSPMMEFSGVRSSWLTLAQNLSLDSEAARSRSDFSSSSAYSATTPRLVCSSSSDSSPYRAITPRLVSCSSALSRTQLVLLLLEVVQRGDQVLVLPPQLVQGGLRVHRGQLLADQPRVRPHAGRAALGHPHDVAVGGDLVHEPGGRGDAVGRGLAVHGHGQQQLGVVDAERDDRGPPGRDGAAAYLAQRGGHPDLVLPLQGQAGGQAAAELAGREDAGRVPDLEAGELAGPGVMTSARGRRRRRGECPPRRAARPLSAAGPWPRARAGRRPPSGC